MRHSFLTPSVERLSSDGQLRHVQDAGVLGRFRRPVILLSRDLCAFSLFEAAAIPPSRRRQAARLHARSAAPYLASGVALTKSGDAFSVWWWDQARVQALLTDHSASYLLRPESMAQPAGRDWRIVKLPEGYEAQLWRGGALVASAWRSTRFDETAWNAFARVQRGAVPAPQTPPQAETLPVAEGSAAFALSPGDISRADALRLGGALAATLIACLSVFWAGQGLGLERNAAKIEQEATEIRASIPRNAAIQGGEADLQRLNAFREVEARTSPLTAAGAAIGILALHDLTPTKLTVEEDILSATLPYSTLNIADELVEEFEQSGYFIDVRPNTDPGGQTMVFVMKAAPSAPPLAAIE